MAGYILLDLEITDPEGFQEYLKLAGPTVKHFILSSHDDIEGILADMGVMCSSRRLVFFSIAGMVAIITSVLAGSFVGLLLAAFSLPLAVTTSAGVVTFLVSVGLHQRYQWRQWLQLGRGLPALFPSQKRQ